MRFIQQRELMRLTENVVELEEQYPDKKYWRNVSQTISITIDEQTLQPLETVTIKSTFLLQPLLADLGYEAAILPQSFNPNSIDTTGCRWITIADMGNTYTIRQLKADIFTCLTYFSSYRDNTLLNEDFFKSILHFYEADELAALYQHERVSSIYLHYLFIHNPNVVYSKQRNALLFAKQMTPLKSTEIRMKRAAEETLVSGRLKKTRENYESYINIYLDFDQTSLNNNQITFNRLLAKRKAFVDLDGNLSHIPKVDLIGWNIDDEIYFQKLRSDLGIKQNRENKYEFILPNHALTLKYL